MFNQMDKIFTIFSIFTILHFFFIHVDPYVYRKADDGLQKVSQQGQDQHVMPRDISNKHIMAYGMYSLCPQLLETRDFLPSIH